jgi:hypothetical protein
MNDLWQEDKNGYFESMPKELRETAQKIIPVELNSQHNNNATKSTVNPKKRPEPFSMNGQMYAPVKKTYIARMTRKPKFTLGCL